MSWFTKKERKVITGFTVTQVIFKTTLFLKEKGGLWVIKRPVYVPWWSWSGKFRTILEKKKED
jgi:hypothetical protein